MWIDTNKEQWIVWELHKAPSGTWIRKSEPPEQVFSSYQKAMVYAQRQASRGSHSLILQARQAVIAPEAVIPQVIQFPGCYDVEDTL